MFTRREFTTGATAAAVMTGCGSPWTAASHTKRDVISPRLYCLADTWNEAGLTYEVVRAETGNLGEAAMKVREWSRPDCPDLMRIRSSRASMLDAAGRLIREPSLTRSDVILKYHAIDTFMTTRPLHGEESFISAGGYDWYRIIEREAAEFDLALNFFWRWGSETYARIDGDRASPLWSEIARWRGDLQPA